MAFNKFCLCLLLSLGILQIGNSSKLTKGGSHSGPHNIRKILVIGATGQAGSRMVKEAVDRGLQVRTFSRNPSKLSEDVKDKVEAVSGDIQNYDDVQKAVKGVDAVIVAISPRSYEDTSKYMAKGVQNVIKAMKAENVEIINVLLSVFAIMPTEEIPEFFRIAIQDQHAMLEALQHSDLKYIASCPPNFITTSFDAYEAKVGGMPGGRNFNGGINVISLNQLGKYFIDSLSEPRYYGKLVGVRNKVVHKQGVKA